MILYASVLMRMKRTAKVIIISVSSNKKVENMARFCRIFGFYCLKIINIMLNRAFQHPLSHDILLQKNQKICIAITAQASASAKAL